MTPNLPRLTALAAACMLAACGGGAPGTGSMTLSVTDAPVDDANRVVVAFTGVELQPRDGERLQFTLPAPRQIDLLNLNGGGSAELLQAVDIPAGTYTFIRLQVNADGADDDSFVERRDGGISPIRIPSGDQRGLQLNGAFVVPEGGIANFIIDFDLRKSLRAPPGQNGTYLMRPTLRIANSDQVGAIGGTVANELAGVEGCAPVVYVYAGADVVPGDEGSASAPLTSAFVTLDEVSGEYRYAAAFLPPGTYTVAFTCDAALDDPDTDDDLAFVMPTTATVIDGQTTAVDFAAPLPEPQP